MTHNADYPLRCAKIVAYPKESIADKFNKLVDDNPGVTIKWTQILKEERITAMYIFYEGEASE